MNHRSPRAYADLRSFNPKIFLAGVSVLALVIASPALAQSSADTTLGASAESGKLDVIIVTAQKRKESLQTTPVAVSSITAKGIIEKGIVTLQDLSASVPGLVVASNVNYGSAPLSIRGVGGANGGGNVFADEPVAVYVDDAIVSRLRMSTADLLDIGTVQVLRGPQGTLYGRNSTAGAILINSAEPSKIAQAYGRFTFGSFGTRKFAGAISGPLTKDGSLSGRLAISLANSDGFGTNSVTGGSIGGSRNVSERASLKWTPTQGLRFDLIIDHMDMTSHPALIAISDVSQLKSSANPTGTNTVYPYTLRANLGTLVDSNVFADNSGTQSHDVGTGVTFKGNYDFGNGYSLTSISNVREWKQNGMQDSDGTGVLPLLGAFVTGAAPNIGENDAKKYDSQYSEELRLGYDNKGNINWLIGAYVFGEKNKIAPIRIRNYLAGPGTAGTEVTFNAGQTTSAWAVFTNFTYKATPKLSLTLGARYSHEEKDFYNYQTVKVINTFDPPGPTIFVPGQLLASVSTTPSNSWENFSPRAVINYQFTKSVMGYYSFSKGFKSGGFNAFNASPASTSFKPESIVAHEVGMKSDLLDRTVRLNLSAFSYNYKNLQLRTPVPTGGVGIETADEAVSRGVEAEGNWVVSPNFRIDANLSYLDAYFEKGSISSVQVSSFVFGTNPAVVAENIAGNRLSRAPKWQGSLSARYSTDVPWGKLTALSTYRYQAKQFFLETQQNQPTYQQKAWDQLDGRLALANDDKGWEIALYGNNLLDKRHFSQITAFFALPVAAVNEPRSVGVQLNLKY